MQSTYDKTALTIPGNRASINAGSPGLHRPHSGRSAHYGACHPANFTARRMRRKSRRRSGRVTRDSVSS
ncbi:hypothetical protein RRG08_055360 [Elysia crispata]|uniref:Uncharacterized protein n=1 Tax=Elysia crispata TaxID=231223 RepID=A0AAE1AQP0_9GAST|nr:hypothetical protein RRG08_055360 [Elysia crispata]